MGALLKEQGAVEVFKLQLDCVGVLALLGDYV